MREEIRIHIKHLLGTILFLSIGLFLLVHVSYLLRPDGSGNYRDVMPGYYALEEDSLDTVFIGNSAVYRFIDNIDLWEKKGITSYNLSTGAMPFETYLYMIKEAEKTQSPDLYVIEIRDLLVEREEEDAEVYLHRVSDNMNYSINRTNMLLHLVKDPQKRMEYLADLVIYHDNWTQLKREDLVYLDNKKADPMMGWDNISRSRDFDKFPEHDTEESQDLPEGMEERLWELLDYCRKEDHQVLFIVSPYQINGQQAERINRVEEIVSGAGYKMLNMTEHYDDIGLDASNDYYNRRHVNVWGARKVTDYLADYLEKNYSIDTEHTESTRASWDAASKLSSEELDKIDEELSFQ